MKEMQQKMSVRIAAADVMGRVQGYNTPEVGLI